MLNTLVNEINLNVNKYYNLCSLYDNGLLTMTDYQETTKVVIDNIIELNKQLAQIKNS